MTIDRFERPFRRVPPTASRWAPGAWALYSCDTCHAEPGQPCDVLDGQNEGRPRRGFHRERQQVATFAARPDSSDWMRYWIWTHTAEARARARAEQQQALKRGDQPPG